MLQISGSGLVAPCGMLFNERYKRYHIGNICDKRFKDIWNSDEYWNVMKYLLLLNSMPKKCVAHSVCSTKLMKHLMLMLKVI